jgi:prepilin-type N-terminal cleavage/methylation domain-containing protein
MISALFPCVKKVGGQGRRGFTLIEVLLAVVILGLGIVGIMRSYAVAARALSISGAKIEALCLVKETFARLEQPSLPNTGSPELHPDGNRHFYSGSKWILKINITDDNRRRPLRSARNEIVASGFCLYGYVAP